MLTVRWYLRYNLSFRDVVEMMEERGLSLAHTTIMRWVHQYGPEFERRIRRHLKQTNDSWRVDETYIKVRGQWMYFYRAVDSEGNTIDFYLSKSRNHKAAKRFFIEMTPLSSRVLTVLIGLTEVPMAIDAALGCYGSSILNLMSFKKMKFGDNSNTVFITIEPLSQADILID
ncbi:IS6 family transposase [Bacillus pseudomycoides]|nr:IS6 family transposase [Bacillus pseudomycoides]